MPRDILFSWRTLVQLSRSANPLLMKWLAERVQEHSVHLCSYSYFKARHNQTDDRRSNSSSYVGEIDRFVKRHFSPESLLGGTDVSPQLYSRIRKRMEFEDLEIFAYGTALARGYTFVCVDQNEAREVEERVPEIQIALLRDILDGIEPFEP